MNYAQIWRLSFSVNPLLMFASFLSVTTATLMLVEAQNQLEYESRSTRIVAGILKLLMRVQHSQQNELYMNPTPQRGRLISIGPHRTGWEAIVVASQLKGAPPQFFATDAFKMIPGVTLFYEMFKVIVIESKASKSQSGQSANHQALEKAQAVLQNKGCVAIFPQGGFSIIGESPRRIYDGTAKIAINNQVPIEVIRLDGFWCFQNPLIPLFIKNNTFFRAFLSFFHMNNVRSHLCEVIDFHLKPENSHLSDEEKIEEINARLFAYYRHTEELSKAEIETIGAKEIAQKTHLSFWKEKKEEDRMMKQNAMHLKNC